MKQILVHSVSSGRYFCACNPHETLSSWVILTCTLPLSCLSYFVNSYVFILRVKHFPHALNHYDVEARRPEFNLSLSHGWQDLNTPVSNCLLLVWALAESWIGCSQDSNSGTALWIVDISRNITAVAPTFLLNALFLKPIKNRKSRHFLISFWREHEVKTEEN